MRPVWKGYLKLSLVSIPLTAFNAITSSDDAAPALHQLHDECKSRIKYQKTCPVHGPVANDEIVSGYEFAKGKHVVIDKDELAEARGEAERSISIDGFVPPDSVDPVYFAGQTYYLIPDGRAGEKSYSLIQQTLVEQGLQGYGQAVLTGRERPVLLRPVENLLVLSVLHFASEVRPASLFTGHLKASKPIQAEVDLAKNLLAALTKEDLDPGVFKDRFAERMHALVATKVGGGEVVMPAESSVPKSIDLMDALRASVRKVTVPKRDSKAAPVAARRKGKPKS